MNQARIGRGQRATSTVIVASIVGLLGVVAIPVAAAESTVPTGGLIGEYLFSQASGASVANSAKGPGAVANATVINGADDLWTGSSLRFSGGAKTSSANWVELPDDILAGKTSASITTEVKIDASMKSDFNFLWNIGNDSTQSYFFTSVRDNPRSAITTSSNGGEVNARSNAALAADRWYSLTSAIDGASGTISFYVDGVRTGQAPTTLTPASINDQSLNTIGRAPYPDPFFKGEISAFRVYDRALTGPEVQAIADHDGQVHADSFIPVAQAMVDGISPVTFDDSSKVLPNFGGAVTWSSTMDGISIGSDGSTASVVQPAAGQPNLTGTITATATVRGVKASKEIAVTVTSAANETDEFGYLMVHFIEDSAGYAEKIYLDISRGDNPEQWDPLNDGQAILASHLGTTGVRDPHLSYNPDTKTYYIIATDLRVFGGDNGTAGCTDWCHWSKNGSTKLNIWESKDLVTWSDLRQIDMAVDNSGTKIAELGMAWAPEATWVGDYYGPGDGAFVVYWSSNVYANDDTNHGGATYSRVLWGATPDFTQESYAFGGTLIDKGGNTIDTTVIQDGGKTYRITKDNGFGNGLYMESTDAQRWWETGTAWSSIQTKIGASWSGGNPGGVEGPATFKKHGEEKWYLYVDVIPSTGYRPMVTDNLDAGWTPLTSSDFYMAPSTKHGGIISLTKSQYDTVRSADAIGAVTSDMGTVSVPEGSSLTNLWDALPTDVAVNLAYNRGTSNLGITWDTAADLDRAGTYAVTGTVQSVGANRNHWASKDGSTTFESQGNRPYSSTAIVVTATVAVLADGTTTGPPTTTPSEAPGPKAKQDLPTTGFEGFPLIGLAVVLLSAGLAVVLKVRRRKQT